MRKPLLVGECGHDPDPSLALWPYPRSASGGRLAAALGLEPREYLARFRRANLCPEGWSEEAARRAAAVLVESATDSDVLVLLGVRVARAFGLAAVPVFARWRADFCGPSYVRLPHPSGRCRAWNDPLCAELARSALREYL